jgi:hypothetical protein
MLSANGKLLYQHFTSSPDCRRCAFGLKAGANWSPSRTARRDYICTMCVNEDSRQRKAARTARLFKEQGLKCAVCGAKDGVTFHLDHCHGSGRERGVLCSRCNQALGLMQDDPARLRRAADYLEQDRKA